ncbi:hypothetical protein V6N13_076662 [Hibiscus sabdariffa]
MAIAGISVVVGLVAQVDAECNLETSLRATKQPSNIGLGDSMVNGQTESISRAKLADVIEYNGHQRKVRQTSEILAPWTEWVEPQKQMQKRGWRRPKKTTNELTIVNGFLSDSDFVQRKTTILKGAEETLKLVGDEAVVMERKWLWISNKATFNSKDCKATTTYDGDIAGDKVGECFG